MYSSDNLPEPAERDDAARAASDDAWALSVLAAALFAIAPGPKGGGVGGVAVAAANGPARDAWLDVVARFLPTSVSVRRLPIHITDDRLLGGLDLAATLAAHRPILARGLLAEIDGGVLVIPGAERLPARVDAYLAATLDRGGIDLQRDGAARWIPTSFGIIALDEALPDEPGLPARLCDRLAIRCDLTPVLARRTTYVAFAANQIEAARKRLPDITIGDGEIAALTHVATLLGIGSLRPVIHSIAVARAHAALMMRDGVGEPDIDVAVRLCLAWRATRIPETDNERAVEPETGNTEPEANTEDEPDDHPTADSGTLDERLIESVRALLPADLLAQLISAQKGSRQPANLGRSGTLQLSKTRGSRIGIRPGDPRGGAQIAIYPTLLAAAPKQRLRQPKPAVAGASPCLQVRPEDFRIYLRQQRRQSLTIFAVDASGSSALHRLGEAKGAVELLLSECYVRRDQVALVAFRGKEAQLLLPPTAALARAKRCLAVLPGGGGTPLAGGLAMAGELAKSASARGLTPTIVVLTDGRANVARDGSPGRNQAEADALAEGERLGRLNYQTLIIDTSNRPDPRVAKLSEALRARYLALPRADAVRIKDAVSTALGQ